MTSTPGPVIVEVAPEDGGWKVTIIRKWLGRTTVVRTESEVITHRRRKRSAVLVAMGAAKALRCELHVKNRQGRYTAAAASFGRDPRNVKG